MATGAITYADQGTVSYNGVRFGSHASVKVSTEFLYDSAQRTVTGHHHRMTITAIVTPDDADGLDPTMESMRQSLSVTGGALVLAATGFGELYVNGSGNPKDLMFGPKPKVLEWAPVGNNLAAEVVWQCEFTTSPCADDTDSGLMSFNYSIDFAINNKGYSTRTVAGELSIAMTRNGRALTDTADAYRSLIVVNSPVNFKRESQNYRLSEDKRTLQFSIVDREIESQNAWPAGVVEIEAKHRIQWKYRGRSRSRLPNYLAANIVLAPDQPKVRAWEIFRALFQNRIARLLSSENPDKYVFIEGFEVDEDLFGTNISFVIEYSIVLGSASLPTIIADSSILSLINIDWASWKQSISAAETGRGVAGLSHLPSQDRIVDLCDTSPGAAQPYNPPAVPPIRSFPVLCNSTPYPQYSWLEFEGTITDETETNTFLVKTLGTPTVTPNTFSAFDPSSTIETISSDALDVEIQGNPYMRFRWKGWAERLGYEIPKPHLRFIGSGDNRVPVKLIGKPRFIHKFMGEKFCVPLYQAAWDFVYEVTERPETQMGSELDPTEIYE